MKHIYNDGGRAAAGFRGTTGDCVARAIAIAAELPYREVYDALARGNAGERKTIRGGSSSGRRTAREGIHVQRKWFKDYMASLGFVYHACMGIGTGCQVHLTDGELPDGRLIVQVSRHYTAVIDGVIHDLYDPQREAHSVEPYRGGPVKAGWTLHPDGDIIFRISRRCVYGFWLFEPAK